MPPHRGLVACVSQRTDFIRLRGPDYDALRLVPILHCSTWPLCRKRVPKQRALKKENSAQLAILKISVAFCPASRPHSGRVFRCHCRLLRGVRSPKP
jgi:hypothetical protein